jgi:NAD/NADP transhydrogenase beta subunit
MCKAMNRSFVSVILGGFGGEAGPAMEITGEQVAIDLENDVQYVSMCPQCYFRERSAFYAARR